MKQNRSWFEVYPHSRQATDLSMVGGAVRLLAILLAIPGALFALGLLAAAGHVLFREGFSWMVWHMLDEMDEEIFQTFFLLAGSAICFYGAHVLRSKASLLAGTVRRDPISPSDGSVSAKQNEEGLGREQ